MENGHFTSCLELSRCRSRAPRHTGSASFSAITIRKGPLPFDMASALVCAISSSFTNCAPSPLMSLGTASPPKWLLPRSHFTPILHVSYDIFLEKISVKQVLGSVKWLLLRASGLPPAPTMASDSTILNLSDSMPRV